MISHEVYLPSSLRSLPRRCTPPRWTNGRPPTTPACTRNTTYSGRYAKQPPKNVCDVAVDQRGCHAIAKGLLHHCSPVAALDGSSLDVHTWNVHGIRHLGLDCFDHCRAVRKLLLRHGATPMEGPSAGEVGQAVGSRTCTHHQASSAHLHRSVSPSTVKVPAKPEGSLTCDDHACSAAAQGRRMQGQHVALVLQQGHALQG